MMRLMRHVPPAGAPFNLSIISRAFHDGEGEKDHLDLLASFLQVEHAFDFNSGRSALTIALKALRTLRPDRVIVAIPAYTCYSVAAAVVRAGLQVWPVDVDPTTLLLDRMALRKIPRDRVLAVVAAHLFGYIDDMQELEKEASEMGAFLIDDAAQSLGAKRGGSLAGTFGDLGISSVARGKALPVGHGGFIVTKKRDIAEVIRKETLNVDRNSDSIVKQGLELAVTSIFLNPSLFWIPNQLPFLRLGVTEFDPAFPISRMSRFSLRMLSETLPQLTALNTSRARNALAISQFLEGSKNVITLRPNSECVPTYLRLPVLLSTEKNRDVAIETLRRRGIGASRLYPGTICNLDLSKDQMYRQRCPGAIELVRRMLTLPTNPLMTESDIQLTSKVLAGIR